VETFPPIRARIGPEYILGADDGDAPQRLEETRWETGGAVFHQVVGLTSRLPVKRPTQQQTVAGGAVFRQEQGRPATRKVLSTFNGEAMQSGD
jgi:hypothetical protein